jgi:hypothetical protein
VGAAGKIAQHLLGAASNCVPVSAALGAAFCFRSSARALAWSVFAAASALSANATSASARVFCLSSLRSDAVCESARRLTPNRRPTLTPPHKAQISETSLEISL